MRWNTSAAPPPQAFQTALAAAFAPDNPCGFSLPHPARHVQAALCRATPCCEPLGWAAAARRGRVQRVRKRWSPARSAEGSRGYAPRGARAKSRPVEFLPRPPGVCPWRAVSAPLQTPGSAAPAGAAATPAASLRPSAQYTPSGGQALAAPGGRYWALVSWGRPRSGGAGATGWVGARGGKGRSRAAPSALAARPAPDRAGPPRGGAPPGTPWQGRRQAGSVGRVSRPQAWAPAGAGGGRG